MSWLQQEDENQKNKSGTQHNSSTDLNADIKIDKSYYKNFYDKYIKTIDVHGS